MTRTPYRYRDKCPREPKSVPPLQPGTRVCRWPGRDLLTGAPVEPTADVRVVSDFAWRGAEQRGERPTEYGVASLPGLGREIAAGQRLVRMRADAAAEADDDDDDDDDDEAGGA